MNTINTIKIFSVVTIVVTFASLFLHIQLGDVGGDQVESITVDSTIYDKTSLPNGTSKSDMLNLDYDVIKKLENDHFISSMPEQYLVCTKEFEHNWFVVTTRAPGENDLLYLGQSLDKEIECSIVNIGEGYENALIANIRTPATGQTGPYHESSIYNWNGTNFETIYRSAFFQDSVNKIDTGFRIEIKEKDFISVENVFTYKKELIDLDSFIPRDFFNELCLQYDGRSPFVCDSTKNNFLSFQPIDIDDDSVFEIIAYENFAISTIDQDYSWCIGICFVALKYDVFTQQLFVVDSGFWCPSNNDESFEEYANNWYKVES